MKIVFVGPLRRGLISWAVYDALNSIGHTIHAVDTSRYQSLNPPLIDRVRQKLIRKPSQRAIKLINEAVLCAIEEVHPDLTFFVNLRAIKPATLDASRQFGPNICLFLDDMFNPGNVHFDFEPCIKRLDCILTNKSFNVSEFRTVGAQNVIFINNGFAPGCHELVQLTDIEKKNYEAHVVLVGTFRPDRADFMGALVEACSDIQITIYGDGWQKMRRLWYWYRPIRWLRWAKLMKSVKFRSVWCDEMASVFSSSKICLGLLHHGNRDLQTTRSIEIPACGGFMLAEFSQEHAELFEENKEAVYFHSFDDLVAKIYYYLEHDSERREIATAGYLRTRRDDYSYAYIMDEALKQFFLKKPLNSV